MKPTILSLLLITLALACNQKPQKNVTPQLSGNIEISDGWVRPGSAGAMTAAFFTIYNGTEQNDSLLSVSSSVTENTEIHESYQMEEGMMGMRPIGLIPVPSGDKVELKPGGLHIMIIRPFMDVNAGDSVDFVLTFSEYGDLQVTFPVRDISTQNEMSGGLH